jgi:integrase
LGAAMVQRLDKLDPLTVKNLTKSGRYGDGGKLWLIVNRNGAKRWAFIYRSKPAGAKGRGRLREMGLGSFADVSLKKARQKAVRCRDWLDDGKDPITEARKEEAPTFGALADKLIATREASLRSDKSVARLKRALGENGYAKALRPLPVDEIGTEQVLGVLSPIWLTKRGTAPNVRAYVKDVLDAAAAKGFRSGDNPARWDGHLKHLLAPPKKLARGHHAAMAYVDVPAFMAELRGREATAALALEFLILTAARSGEVLGARWGEIDLAGKLWTIPPARMKAGREHRVPLGERALKILAGLTEARTGSHVFAGPKPGKDSDNGPLSSMAFAMLLRRMKRDVTTHGFRSAFRDWAGSASTFPRELAEEALAHAVGDETERAYRRRDAIEKRRKLMEAWANYCEPGMASSNVRHFEQRVVASGS